VSVSPAARSRTAETVAGMMASLALFVSAIGIFYRPVRVIPLAVVVALIAAVIGGRHERLAAAAVGFGTIAFIVGLGIASAFGRPLW
jgi:predicted membrane protein